MKANRLERNNNSTLIYAASLMGLLTAGFISLPVFLQQYSNENAPFSENFYTALFQASLFASGLTGVATLELMRKLVEDEEAPIDPEPISTNYVPNGIKNDRKQLESQWLRDDDLSSEKGIDYTKLRDLLKAGQWKEADRETDRVMLQAVGRQENDYLREDEIKTFPSTDLLTIDRLWVKYSDSRFGFSVQKRIYVEAGNPLDGEYYKEEFDRFGDRVGWRVKNRWISYSEVTFSISAPFGHLPYRVVTLMVVLFGLFSRGGVLFSREEI